MRVPHLQEKALTASRQGCRAAIGSAILRPGPAVPMVALSVLLALAGGACGPSPSPAPVARTPTSQPLAGTQTPVTEAPSAPSPEASLPAVGQEPSSRVAAFYYPWYGNPRLDGEWIHWKQGGHHPPLDIGSDYFPMLGAYSAIDPDVVAQHFAWLRQAGVGVIISSWWGQGTYEDRALPVLLDIAERFGIKIALHIEPYGGRTARRLLEEVEYIYSRYGNHPALFRTTASTRWSPDNKSKGLFFVWAIGVPDFDSEPVPASYWQEAMDAIHALPDGGLVIANTTLGGWIDGGHFDGLYNYATLDLKEAEGFTWAQSIPPDAWYVPSVLPGFLIRRASFPGEEPLVVPRRDGATYDAQWQAALSVGVEPDMVTITSFNEWHEGTQIEPAAIGATDGQGQAYEDYRPLPPDGYLSLTRRWAERFLATTWLETYRGRIRMTTTSDWTSFGLVDGGAWLRPSLVSAGDEATFAWFERGRLLLMQPLNRAEQGERVEMVVDLLFTGLDPEGLIVFEIERGHLGKTIVELSNYLGGEPVTIETFQWGGINPGERNALQVQIPSAKLMASEP